MFSNNRFHIWRSFVLNPLWRTTELTSFWAPFESQSELRYDGFKRWTESEFPLKKNPQTFAVCEGSVHFNRFWQKNSDLFFDSSFKSVMAHLASGLKGPRIVHKKASIRVCAITDFKQGCHIWWRCRKYDPNSGKILKISLETCRFYSGFDSGPLVDFSMTSWHQRSRRKKPRVNSYLYLRYRSS